MSEYKHNIDSKGRLIIPAKIREQLGENFTITRGLDGCIYAHPEEEWKEFQGNLKKLPIADPKARRYVRFFTSGSTPCEVDKQGRFLIPQTLRDYAKLKKEVIISWNIDKAEIWSKERWDEINAFEDMDDIALDLLEKGYIF
ncbi:MAG: division/cell wall cluster transcriptional repressor MraZ [Lachnospiraceae bacterium]|nr:division/cell wall cluster transcriptional repressor MraZ [Lachnospiraceae bacterium]